MIFPLQSGVVSGEPAVSLPGDVGIFVGELSLIRTVFLEAPKA